MCKYFNATVLLCLFISITDTAIADNNVYSYQDANGNTIISNTPHTGSKQMTLPELPVYARPMSKSDALAHGYTNPPTSYTVKTSSTPSTNSHAEAGRTALLTEELNHEQNALTTSQKLLVEAKSMSHQDPKTYNNRIQILNDAITEHQKNIDILTKQIQN